MFDMLMLGIGATQDAGTFRPGHEGSRTLLKHDEPADVAGEARGEQFEPFDGEDCLISPVGQFITLGD
jgi:hypothetical protein